MNVEERTLSRRVYAYKVRTLASVERALHWLEVLGCIAATCTAVRSREPQLAFWSVSALATSLVSLYLLAYHPTALQQPAIREPWYASVRLHRAFSVVAMRRVLKDPVNLRSPSYFLKALLVNSSVLPILLQSLILQLQLPLQGMVQVACAAVVIGATPEYCASLQRDGIPGSDWEILAKILGGLSHAVMAATAGSRSDYHPSEIPCQVSMSYLVLVSEVLLPLMFAYYYNRASVHWYTAQQAQHGGAPHQHRHAAGQGRQGGAEEAGGKVLYVPPPALLALVYLGVCGVVWDVTVTISKRWVQEGGWRVVSGV